MGPCPRCGTRLLPGALACINCDLPLTPSATEPTEAPSGVDPRYSPYAPSPSGWPPYGGPQPAYPAGPPGPAPWSTNGLSIASVILSVVWLGGIGSLVAVVFGHVARGQIRRRPQRGDGLALAGLIIGYLGVIGAIVFWSLLPTIIASNLVQNQLVQQDLRNAADAERSYQHDNGSYTQDGTSLRAEGFTPLGRDTILLAYNTAADGGFCIVGAHNGSSAWYLYDSKNNGLSTLVYATQDEAESHCSANVSNTYNPIK
ncbi:MAG TPA: DUF4190 domain-containing protein [Mycobacteriales bacterium]|nr:DUF4190 domain-containing protein [Mycobacteriales bacterium]